MLLGVHCDAAEPSAYFHPLWYIWHSWNYISFNKLLGIDYNCAICCKEPLLTFNKIKHINT